MLFNSLEFIYGFLPIVFVLFYVSSKIKTIQFCKVLLLLASLFFYGYWDYNYLWLIVLSMVFNYAIAFIVVKWRSLFVLASGVAGNLIFLSYYKYFNFFLDNLGYLTGIKYSLNIILPLGISFFTFQQIGFIVDAYHNRSRPYRFTDYMLGVVFFPQLIAGPILRYSELMPQFMRMRSFVLHYKNVYQGFFFFFTGLFQKIVIADYLSPIVNNGFSNAPLLSFFESWGTLLAYAFQIYFDFAGYSNMAIGLGYFFNIRLPINFNSPYQAVSLIDFWRRWHMTLSRFLLDYLYVPLGGNRKGVIRQYINIMITMLLGGLWHGASWTFVVWGAYHGALIVINHQFINAKVKIHEFFSRAATFIFVCYGWVFFRSPDFTTAKDMTLGLLGFHGVRISNLYFIWKQDVIAIFFILLIAVLFPNAQHWSQKLKPDWPWVLVIALVFFADIIFLNRASVFLYFQF